MLASQIPKGTRVVLDSGFEATILDNPKNGDLRRARVEGMSINTGDVAVWTIASLADGTPVELSSRQLSAKDFAIAMLGPVPEQPVRTAP